MPVKAASQQQILNISIYPPSRASSRSSRAGAAGEMAPGAGGGLGSSSRRSQHSSHSHGGSSLSCLSSLRCSKSTLHVRFVFFFFLFIETHWLCEMHPVESIAQRHGDGVCLVVLSQIRRTSRSLLTIKRQLKGSGVHKCLV